MRYKLITSKQVNTKHLRITWYTTYLGTQRYGK